MRLDKYISNMGKGTRSEVKKMIQRGLVKVNNEPIRKIGHVIKEGVDVVTVNGETVGYDKHVYIMLNKPQDVISATEDRKHKTVIDLVSETYGNRKLFPVGRLDIDTEGLLLITDDGRWSHELMSPKKHVNKTYYAKIDNFVTPLDADLFEQGITLEDGTVCKPGILKILSAEDESEIELTITEGKYHQVKRMFEAIGMNVTYLKRISVGHLKLDESLALGEYRELTEEEKNHIK